MVYYTLSSDPNQTFEVAPEGSTYVFSIKRIRGLMYVTIDDIDGNRLSGPIRICNTEWLIPFDAYNYEGAGNFMIINREGEYPDFENFMDDCELRYYTKEEINELTETHG